MKSNSILRLLLAIGATGALPFKATIGSINHPVGTSDFQHTIQTEGTEAGFLKPWDSPIL